VAERYPSFTYTGSDSSTCRDQLHARIWNDLDHANQFNHPPSQHFDFQVAQFHTETFSARRLAATGKGHDVKNCGALAARLVASQMETRGAHSHRVQYGWGLNPFMRSTPGCKNAGSRKIARISIATTP
jgi:hypothetical protein